jgi:hypothetical protein
LTDESKRTFSIGISDPDDFKGVYFAGNDAALSLTPAAGSTFTGLFAAGVFRAVPGSHGTFIVILPPGMTINFLVIPQYGGTVGQKTIEATPSQTVVRMTFKEEEFKPTREIRDRTGGWMGFTFQSNLPLTTPAGYGRGEFSFTHSGLGGENPPKDFVPIMPIPGLRSPERQDLRVHVDTARFPGVSLSGLDPAPTTTTQLADSWDLTANPVIRIHGYYSDDSIRFWVDNAMNIFLTTLGYFLGILGAPHFSKMLPPRDTPAAPTSGVSLRFRLEGEGDTCHPHGMPTACRRQPAEET